VSTISPGHKIHGPAKRLRVIASLPVEIGLASLPVEIGLAQQRMSHDLAGADTPLLTRDVALSLIDDRITAAGTRGVTATKSTPRSPGSRVPT
jgi:hypothetical protein